MVTPIFYSILLIPGTAKNGHILCVRNECPDSSKTRIGKKTVSVEGRPCKDKIEDFCSVFDNSHTLSFIPVQTVLRFLTEAMLL